MSAIVSPCIAIDGVARAAATSSRTIAASFEKRDVVKMVPPTDLITRTLCARSVQLLDTIYYLFPKNRREESPLLVNLKLSEAEQRNGRTISYIC